ncbi:MAG TPA: hypothetical protein VEB40_03890 [Flavipsychrobacter sp.]|nr:hypothetical protein [Flavipsychrobacter sp.]
MRIVLSILLLTMFFSCSNNANNNAVDDSTRIRELPADSNEVSIEELDEDDFYVWKVDGEEKTMRKNPKLADASLGVDTLIIGLNEMYPNVKLEKVKLSNDTLYTQIKKSDYLTERMGSAGSEAYIAQAVLNLTTAQGVKFVRIDFEMGSHAMPDTWSKENFKDYKPVQ